MKSSPSPVAQMHTGVRGRFSVKVVNADGTIDESKTYAANQNSSNLILDSGLDLIGGTRAWRDCLAYGVAGTDGTPNVNALDGTFARSGTTVTRSSGAGEFEAGDVGKLIVWGSGEQSYITSFSSATEVEVEDSGVIAADTVTVYAVDETTLGAEVKRSNTKPEYTDTDGYQASDSYFDDDAGTVTLKRTFDFSAEGAGGETYAEVGVAPTSSLNLFSRMVLSVPVFVDEGQQLRLTYYLTLTIGGSIPSLQETVDGGITGWPRPYTIDEIVSTVSDFTVTLTETHHYSAGGIINISGATPSGYDGEWTIDSVAGADITILDTSDLGAGSGGTVYNNTRRKLVMVNSGVRPLLGYGVPDNTVAKAFAYGRGDSSTGTQPDIIGIFDGGADATDQLRLRVFGALTAPTKPFSAWDSTTAYPADGSSHDTGRSNVSLSSAGGNNPTQEATAQTYTSGNFYRDYIANWPAGALNSDGPFRSIVIARESGGFSANGILVRQGYILFEEPQRKDSTHTLTLTFRVSWGRDFSS